MKQLFVLLSIAVTVAAAVTVVAAVIWVIETIRHRNSKAKPILKVAALITIACFAGTGITYALGGAPEPKSIEQLQEPVQNLEPKPEDDSPSSSPTTPPELTETLEDAVETTTELTDISTSNLEPTTMLEESVPTETQTPSPAPTNEGDAIATDEPLSLDSVILAIKLSLATGFGDNYTLTTEGNTISATVWADGVALNATFASLGDTESLETWNDLVSSTLSAAEQFQSLLNDSGHGDIIFIMQIANDLNTSHDTVLLSVSLNVVFYDYVNGVNLFED